MTTIQPAILQCPFCKQQQYHYELMSFTVYNSTCYSDGKLINEPFLNNDNAIKICSSCNQTFWVEDAEFATENPYEIVETVPQALDILDLPFNLSENSQEGRILFFDKLLKEGFANTNKKKHYLRIRLWWSINDLVRYRIKLVQLLKEVLNSGRFRLLFNNRTEQKKGFRKFKDLFKENLLQLIVLIDVNTDDDLLLVAEAYRELGRFRKAKQTLNNSSLNQYSATRKIKREIFLQRKRVIKF